MSLNLLLQPISEWIVGNPDLFVIGWASIMFLWLFSTAKQQQSHKSTFTILGMLGTFIGLVAGLWMFDSSDMDGSIITLLNGLKVSFLTSIIGIICSLAYSYIGKKNSKEGKELDIHELLLNISNNTSKTSENIDKLVTSLGGDSDNSLVGQIKLLKTDMNDNHKSLSRTMEKFAEEVSKASTDAIVEALQDVVKNFNEKITDQFGEHFKHLNQAVEKLVIWQSEYKDYLEGFKNNLEIADKTVKDNTEITKSLSSQMSNIESHTKNIPENLKLIEDIIQKQKEELIGLVETLGAFSKIKEEASKTIPEIESHLNGLVKNLSTSIKETTDNISTEFSKNAKEFGNITSEAVKSSELQKQEITRNIDGMQKSIQTELSNSAKQIDDSMKEVFIISDGHIKKQVQDIIEQMGSELTSISRHLANDYKELSSALTESVDLIKKSNIN